MNSLQILSSRRCGWPSVFGLALAALVALGGCGGGDLENSGSAMAPSAESDAAPAPAAS